MTDKENIDKQDRIIELLEEILRWTRLQGVQNARNVLNTTLTTDMLKTVYQLSDGRASEEIGKTCGITGMSVRNYWKRWFTVGIVQPSRKFKGRFERIFSLPDLGIEAPAIAGSKVTIKEKEGVQAEAEED